ncbi:hypothetical protein [Saccharopolyspora gloriosae]|uniref:hypothetical protein n=1 Tax=Saccharopolyspora gloriosae TaxID=455344 RepID=UPI001FB7E9A2|nr:hypothetical protein [Saccharopolyspora gloriosae]
MIIEIRTYRLEPGTGESFARLLREESVPMLRRFGIRVLDHGNSLVAEDGHEEAYLVRAFPDLETRAAQEETFYGSAAWKSGPREAIVSRISSYHTIVLETSEQAAASLDRSGVQ